ncbi:MAG: hypothetical protein QOD66_3379 [Solirubrobacteraceae bacterium]|jgi:hypothetical protein|nr:hypothetical protein [Solirubrobacteraceae bacterium]
MSATEDKLTERAAAAFSFAPDRERTPRVAAYTAAPDREECAAELYPSSVRQRSRSLWQGHEADPPAA